MARAFVIRPFNVKKDSAGNPLDFERVHAELIAPALAACALAGATTGEVVEPGNIREDMFSLIIEADVVVCDITIHNANVFYELGIRHALRKKRTVMLKGAQTADATPFDILTDRYVAYEVKDPAKAVDALTAAIQAALVSERTTDSPVFAMLPDLPEVDPKRIQAVPLGFREEIGRACAAQSKGWLRLLAHDVRGTRFERSGLQLVAEALWSLGDYAAAREAFEQIRDVVQDDDAVNLALANIYERLYRSQGQPQLLGHSDQAIGRVLASPTADSASRVEALALRGRNQKTRWREQFERRPDLAERRSAAMNQALRDSYEAYREAFRQDLNHFYSGIAALQMGVMFLDLSSGDDDGWLRAFDTDEEALAYRQRVAADVTTLRPVVAWSADAALKRPDSKDSHLWARVTRADLLFVGESPRQDGQRIAARYRDAIPRDKPFVWNAAKGQLGLFAALGVRADVAEAVIAAVEAAPGAAAAPAPVAPRHVVVFAGHRTDDRGRTTPRFPSAAEARAVAEIERVLREYTQTHRVTGLASGAPGADILFHEACGRLDIPSTVCLPMRQADYVGATFGDLDWRGRFLTLLEQKTRLPAPAILELSDRPGLPGWLQAARTDPWERGNRWVLEMAQTAGADRVTLLALWDGADQGDAPGGTAHMVALARTTAGVRIEVIRPQDLLEPAGT